MEFGFSETQTDVQTLARQILSEQVSAEKLAAYDEFADKRFDRDLWAQLGSAGLLGVAVDERYGGMGFGFMELALLLEEAGRTLAPVPLVSHSVSAALAIQQFGSETQRQQWLPGAAAGTKLLTAALLEAGIENPAAPALTTATASGDGYTVTGTKQCVPLAQDADRILLSAVTDAGVVVLLVDPSAAGVSCVEQRYTTYETQYEVRLESVTVAAKDVLAGPDAGAEVMNWIARHTTAALCVQQLGLCDQAMRMTASYTAERQQFGVPIATFQAVGHRAANCFIDVECLRLNAYQAAGLLAAGNDATTEVQIAKIWAADVGHRVSYASQHMHGGTGIDRDYPLWRFCLFARHNELMLGGASAQLSALGDRIAAGQAGCH